jgi:hypothetical protein
MSIPETETPNMQMTTRSSVIGESPRLEIRGTERREASREIFGEGCKHRSQKAALVLGDQHRIEASMPVTGNRQRQGAIIG